MSISFDMQSELAAVGVHATPEQLRLFEIHYQLLLRWNRKINLTAIRDPKEILRRHFAESAFLTQILSLGPGTLLDVGSGAGFPGVPLKILSPQTTVVLVESVQKKAAFLKELARELGLPGLEVHAGRLESIDYKANWLTMRAVRADQALLAEIHTRIVPRGTIAFLLSKKDAKALGPDWQTHAIPGRDNSVVAVCAT
jgi:16S rRNA (guanine527-N7)-methyltransferase